YDHTGQTCPRFKVDSPLEAGEILRLGDYGWKVAAAPGHDPDAVLLYQPDSGVVLTGDALWEQRLAKQGVAG
ncbi:MBL fold metallo-hydrolase, partial [Rubrivivax gelatinosus]|uniref:MBL fold metallo-hydrolase n=1 Tax=Rubrivivax gelatinosus TaxID=28068 RepID=UPI0005C1AE8B